MLTHKEKIKLEQEWFKNNNKMCINCGRTENLTIDHILPEWLLEQFGIPIKNHYDPDNLQCLCRICNTFKGNKLDFTNPKTKILLLKYLNLV
jgi:5-methylcytosine-specific restriction endonuclease McrA